MNLSSKTILLVLVAMLVLPLVGANAERVPLLETRVTPKRLNVPQPCPLTKVVTLQFRNNSLSETIDVDWSSAYIQHPLECVADYDPKSNSILSIPPQGVKSQSVTLSFIGECEGTTQIKFTGVIRSTPLDSDTDTLTVFCNQLSAPTLSQWVLIALTLSVGGFFVWQLMRRRKAAPSV